MSTFRTDLVAHLMTVAAAYRTANPTILRKVYSRRPGSFGDVPLLFLGDRNEEATDTPGTIQREINVPITIVAPYGDNEQTADRIDVAVDGLLSAFRLAANGAVGNGLITNVSGVEDFDLTVTNPETGKSFTYASSTFTVTALIQEGRP